MVGPEPPRVWVQGWEDLSIADLLAWRAGEGFPDPAEEMEEDRGTIIIFLTQIFFATEAPLTSVMLFLIYNCVCGVKTKPPDPAWRRTAIPGAGWEDA